MMELVTHLLSMITGDLILDIIFGAIALIFLLGVLHTIWEEIFGTKEERQQKRKAKAKRMAEKAEKKRAAKAEHGKITVDKLAKQAHSGDAESMFQLAIRAYWRYDVFPGLESRTHKGVLDWISIFHLLNAAGEHGDAAMNRKVGDFFRNEFQEDQAQTHYLLALERALKRAAKGDAEAMFAVAEQYAIGLGVAQDHDKAAFWLQAAARRGHREAKDMLGNLWQDGSALPVSGAMGNAWADHLGKLPKAADPALDSLRTAAVRREILADRLETARRLVPKKLPIYRVTDLSQTVKSRLYHVFCCLWRMLLVAVMALSSAGLFAAMFLGYRETGIIHVLSQILYYAQSLPWRILLFFAEGTPFFGWTPESFFRGFYEGPFDGDLAVMLLHLPITFVLCLIPAALFFLILYYLVSSIIGHLVGDIRGIVISSTDPADNKSRIDVLEQKLAQAAQTLTAQLRSNGLSAGQYTCAEILAMYDVAAFMNLPDAAAAASVFEQMRAHRERISLPICVRGSRSRLVLYFAMHRILPTASQWAGICAQPKYNFPATGSFMQGSRAYRRGQDFCAAENHLKDALKASPDSPEAGFAAWNLHLLWLNERMHDDRTDTEYNEHCKQRAGEYLQLAVDHGCFYAGRDIASEATLLWQCRETGMRRLDALHWDNHAYPSEMHQYFLAMAAADIARRHECGEPLNRAKWNDYDTGCAWPIYFSVYQRVQKYEASGHFSQGSLYGLRQEAEKALLGGVYSAETLYAKLTHWISEEEANTRRAEEKRQNRYRQIAEEEARRRAWETAQDEKESERNLYIYGNTDTDWERHLSGRMSTLDYLDSSSHRSSAYKEFEEAETERLRRIQQQQEEEEEDEYE